MAIIYDATIVPGKLDIIGGWLDRQPWAGRGTLAAVGSYRFDDPAGEVGVEAMILRRGEQLLHVPVTYRPGPLDGAEGYLLGTVEHSVLGRRWVYDATGDPVAVACFGRALRDQQHQAVLEIWEGETMLEVREPDVRLRLEVDGTNGGVRAVEVGADDVPVRIAQVLDRGLDGSSRLVARWKGGEATVAVLADV